MTIVVIPLIDRLGRKILLTVPIAIIIGDFVALIVFLSYKGRFPVFSYLSIACILIFICFFAVGLGPVAFIYTAECFRNNARSAAMSVSIAINWTSSLLLTLFFPFLGLFMK